MKLKGLLLASVISALAFESIADERVVRVGTEPSFAPFEFMDENTKELTGFDIDLIYAIAKASNFKVEMSSMPFDGLIPAILTGTLDAGISGFTITNERAKRVAFSEPYLKAGLGVIVRDEVKDKIKSVSDLDGQKICAQIGTSGAMYSTQQVKGATVTQFNSAPEAFLELTKGGCDALINDKPVLEYYIASTGAKKLSLLEELITADEYGIVMNKNDEELVKLINDGFAKVKADGTLKAIQDKWFKAK